MKAGRYTPLRFSGRKYVLKDLGANSFFFAQATAVSEGFVFADEKGQQRVGAKGVDLLPLHDGRGAAERTDMRDLPLIQHLLGVAVGTMVYVRFVLPAASRRAKPREGEFLSRLSENLFRRPAAGAFEPPRFGIELQIVPAARTFFSADDRLLLFGVIENYVF